jgi:hypothetical protein
LSVTIDMSVVFSGSSTNKTDHHVITEILLKVALSTIQQTNKQTNMLSVYDIILVFYVVVCVWVVFVFFFPLFIRLFLLVFLCVFSFIFLFCCLRPVSCLFRNQSNYSKTTNLHNFIHVYTCLFDNISWNEEIILVFL